MKKKLLSAALLSLISMALLQCSIFEAQDDYRISPDPPPVQFANDYVSLEKGNEWQYLVRSGSIRPAGVGLMASQSTITLRIREKTSSGDSSLYVFDILDSQHPETTLKSKCLTIKYKYSHCDDANPLLYDLIDPPPFLPKAAFLNRSILGEDRSVFYSNLDTAHKTFDKIFIQGIGFAWVDRGISQYHYYEINQSSLLTFNGKQISGLALRSSSFMLSALNKDRVDARWIKAPGQTRNGCIEHVFSDNGTILLTMDDEYFLSDPQEFHYWFSKDSGTTFHGYTGRDPDISPISTGGGPVFQYYFSGDTLYGASAYSYSIRPVIGLNSNLPQGSRSDDSLVNPPKDPSAWQGNRFWMKSPLQYTDDNGKTWVPVDPAKDGKDLLSRSGPTAISANAINVLLSKDAKIAVSLDSGNSWSYKSTPPTFSPSDYSIIEAIGNRIFLAGAGGIFYSNDNGDTWTFTYGGWEASSIYSLKASDNLLLVGTCSGLFELDISTL